jgi:PEP-CTERM motif-containing protein
MEKSLKLDSARLLASAAAIVVPMAMSVTPAHAGASGGGGTVFITEGSCTICTGDITSGSPTSAIVSMTTGDPANPTDQQNTGNWGDIFFAFGGSSSAGGGGASWEIISADEPSDSPLSQSAINALLSLPSSSVTYQPEDFTQIDFLQIGTFKFESQVIEDGDSPVDAPEPGSAALLGAAVAALALLRRRPKA